MPLESYGAEPIHLFSLGLLVILIFFFTPLIKAQFHEIGIFLGGSNYVGDVGSHRYLDPNELIKSFFCCLPQKKIFFVSINDFSENLILYGRPGR